VSVIFGQPHRIATILDEDGFEPSRTPPNGKRFYEDNG
jgi:hypothetical protein